jgi:hypothetical protein
MATTAKIRNALYTGCESCVHGTNTANTTVETLTSWCRLNGIHVIRAKHSTRGNASGFVSA